jgi:hypothetical protein
LGNIPKKTAYWMSKKAEQARLQARIEFDRKYPLKLKLKELLWKTLEKIDPIETAAIACGAVFLHGTIPAMVADILGLKTEEILNEGASWSMSFFVSYLLVHHFGDIALAMAEVGKGLLGIIEGLVIGGATAGISTKAAATAIWTVPTSFIGFITPMPFGKESTAFYESWIKEGKPSGFALKG